MNDNLLETLIILFITIGLSLFGILIICRIVELIDYNKCSETNFKSNFCEKYKNY